LEQPDALILTGIGIGTSFSVLVLLLIAVLVIKLVSRLFDKEDQEELASQEEDAPAVDPEARNRATAAAIAVTALLESRPYLRSQPSDD
jgi:Na+-transporting methylmalonyl-CoA/oxaloacetate decarboxylase gamma subunit